MHRTLREMPGPAAEMTALTARWDPATFRLELVNCGHAAPLMIRADGNVEQIDMPATAAWAVVRAAGPREHVTRSTPATGSSCAPTASSRRPPAARAWASPASRGPP